MIELTTKWILIVASLVFLNSCGLSDKPEEKATSFKSLEQRLSEANGYTKNEKGEFVPKNDKRSIYDRRGESLYSQEKVKPEAYKTEEFKKKSWWGKEEFAKQAYAGNTDGSRFQNKARQDGQVFGDGSRKANDTEKKFTTQTLASKAARETKIFEKSLQSKSSAQETEQDSYPLPAIIDWKEQRSMSLEQSKGILGR